MDSQVLGIMLPWRERLTAVCAFVALLCPALASGATADSRPSWCSVTESKQVTMSADGRLLLVATPSPPMVRIFDSELKEIRVHPVVSRDGKTNSTVYAAYDATARHSLVIVLRDLPEIWEVSYDPKAEPIYDGLVHDYRMGEALATSGYLGIRRTILRHPLRDIFFDEHYRHVIGLSRRESDGKLHANVINLDIRRSIAEVDMPDSVSTEAGFAVNWNGGSVTAVHSPKTSYDNGKDILRRYCAP